MKIYHLIFFVAIFCFSCKKDTPDPLEENVPLIQPHGGVFIINEGTFKWNNGSVSYYRFSDRFITEDVFKAANELALGDVFQSMEVFNGKAYLVINNSGKIEIVDPLSFKSLGVIRGLSSPRYFLGIDSSKAYVSDLKSNYISVIDLNTKSKVKEIRCPGWTEEMVLVDQRAYVTNIKKEYLYVINTATDVLIDSIKVGPAPGSIVGDKNNKLWVIGGDSYTHRPGSICRVDPKTNVVELQINFPEGAVPHGLKINGTKDTLYYLNKGIYQFPISQTIPLAAPLIPQKNFSYYGLGIDPRSGNIYASDAIDYVQNGIVNIYTSHGTPISNFKAGIIPRAFYFY
ncbi:MAG TPA: DUF5074 domain-containing protein [Cytophagaceae bacterium]|jgi:YVTN family beta-propeller protein